MFSFRAVWLSFIVLFACEAALGLRRSSKVTKRDSVMQSEERQLLTTRSDEMQEGTLNGIKKGFKKIVKKVSDAGKKIGKVTKRDSVMQSEERQLLTRRSDEVQEGTLNGSQECCKKIKKGFKKTVKKVSDAGKKIGNDAGKTVVDVGNKVSDLGKEIGKDIGDGVVFAFEFLKMILVPGVFRVKFWSANVEGHKLCVSDSGSGNIFNVCSDGDEKTKFDLEAKDEDKLLFKAVNGGKYMNVKSDYTDFGDPVFQSDSDDSGSQWKMEDGGVDVGSVTLKSRRSGRYLQAGDGKKISQRPDPKWPYAHWFMDCVSAPGGCRKMGFM